jgi:hypothetical protein
MTAEQGATGTPHPPAQQRAREQDLFGLEGRERDLALAWVGEHLTEVRESASGQRVFYWILATAFVLGLGAHVGGFLLKESATAEPLLLVADLLYALGFALWTSVIVVTFVEIWPAAKRRQYKRVLDAYEAAVAGRARVGGGRAPDPASAEEG